MVGVMLFGLIRVGVWVNLEFDQGYCNLRTVLRHLPAVRDEEGDMSVDIVEPQKTYHRWYTDSLGTHKNNCPELSGPHEELFVSVFFSPRRLSFDDTLRAFTKWLTRLGRNVPILDLCVKIEGWDRRVIIDDPEPWYLIEFDEDGKLLLPLQDYLPHWYKPSY